MERIPEPELMEEKEQVISYAQADFSEGEVNLINQINSLEVSCKKNPQISSAILFNFLTALK